MYQHENVGVEVLLAVSNSLVTQLPSVLLGNVLGKDEPVDLPLPVPVVHQAGRGQGAPGMNRIEERKI